MKTKMRKLPNIVAPCWWEQQMWNAWSMWNKIFCPVQISGGGGRNCVKLEFEHNTCIIFSVNAKNLIKVERKQISWPKTFVCKHLLTFWVDIWTLITLIALLALVALVARVAQVAFVALVVVVAFKFFSFVPFASFEGWKFTSDGSDKQKSLCHFHETTKRTRF